MEKLPLAPIFTLDVATTVRYAITIQFAIYRFTIDGVPVTIDHVFWVVSVEHCAEGGVVSW